MTGRLTGIVKLVGDDEVDEAGDGALPPKMDCGEAVATP